MFDRQILKGMDLLGRMVPDWKDRLNLDTLDLGSQENCILGQIFKSYEVGLSSLKLTYGFEHGFSVSPVGNSQELTRQWKVLLGSPARS